MVFLTVALGGVAAMGGTVSLVPATMRFTAPTTRPAAKAVGSVPAAGLSATTRPSTMPVAPTSRPAPPDPCCEAIIAMSQSLRDSDDPQITAAAEDALLGLGARAVPALLGLQNDPEVTVRRRVLGIALSESDPHAAGPLLAGALHDGDAVVRLEAARQINKSRLDDPSAVIGAAEALSDVNEHVRREVFEYLSDLGEDAAPAVPTLARSLDIRSIQVLAGVGRRATAAVPALVKWYQDKSRPTKDRLEALTALRRILETPVIPSTQPALADAH